MITLTLMFLTVLGGLVGGIFKFIFAIFGVIFELFLIGLIVTSIGVFGFGILLLIDIIFFIVKVVR